MRVRVVAALVAVIALAGCAPATLTRSGVPPPPTSLRIAVAEPAGRFTDDVALEFVRQVADLSGGALRVELARRNDPVPRWNQRLAERVMSAEVDLALIPAQAWDAFGVRTLTALYVPFLVGSDALLDAIATDPVAADMLAGLASLGVTGLALVPGGLRHVFAPVRPLAGPADFTGVGIRVAYSETVWAYLRALGAEPDDPNGLDVAASVRSGRLSAVDSMFAIVDDFIDAPATTAGLVTYPHALTLVGSAVSLGALSDEEREWLQEAARATAAWSVRTRPSDADQARRLCERAPGAVVNAGGSAELAQLKESARPVADAVRADAGVDALARRIEELDAALGHPTSVVMPCVGPVLAVPPAQPTAGAPSSFPEGVYRRRITQESLVDAGVTATVAAGHAGLWTLDFDNGRLLDPGCPGSTYAVTDGRVVVTSGPSGPSCGEAAGLVLFSAAWNLVGNQLTFVDVRSGHGSEVLIRALFGGGPWTKIG